MSDTLPSDVEADDLPIVRTRPLVPSVDYPEDPTREFDAEEVNAFFSKAVEGYGPWEIGLELGWSPALIKRFLGNPVFAEYMDAIKQGRIDSWERALDRGIREGNQTLIRYGLNTQARDRGYSDTRRVQVDTRAQQEIVISVREGLDEKTRALVEQHGEAGIAALQAAFDEDDDIVDGEVVE